MNNFHATRFFFTRGNTVIDGIINIVLIIFVVELFSSTIDSLLWGNIRNYFDSGSCYLYSPISIISELFDNKLSACSLASVSAVSAGRIN